MHRLEAYSFESSSKMVFTVVLARTSSVSLSIAWEIYEEGGTAEIWPWCVDRNFPLNTMERELRISDSKEWKRFGVHLI